MNKNLLSSTILAGIVAASTAHAAPVFFTDRGDFEAALGGALLSFEGFEAIQPVGATHTYAGFTLTESNGTNAVTNTNVNGALNAVTEGSGAAWYDDNGNSIGTFAFNAAINAFGMDITTDEPSIVSIMSDAFNFDFNSAGSTGFFGVIADSMFSSFTVDASGGPLIGFDALAYGEADPVGGEVPLPAGGMLLLGGLGALAALRRRKT